eukprot:7365317-Pyramimonas_sp.AAC.1
MLATASGTSGSSRGGQQSNNVCSGCNATTSGPAIDTENTEIKCQPYNNELDFPLNDNPRTVQDGERAYWAHAIFLYTPAG